VQARGCLLTCRKPQTHTSDSRANKCVTALGVIANKQGEIISEGSSFFPGGFGENREETLPRARDCQLDASTVLCDLVWPCALLRCRFTLGAERSWGNYRDANDPSTAAIADAAVTAINSATGVRTRTSTSSDGTYTIPLLAVGTYQVTAAHVGFKALIRDGVVVEVGQTTRVDILMQLGSITEAIKVRAAPLQLRPDTSDLGTVITGQQVLDLPLAGHGEQRNPAFFMTLIPGVTGHGVAYSNASDFNSRILSTTVAGSQSASNEFHLDGSIIASAGEFSADFRTLGFPPDAVGEFKITTINAPAEYGRSGGGITSFTLKSGTNRLHGSAYEYFRNEKLDAVPFFVNSSPPGCSDGGRLKACRAINKQNELGATAGGPIRRDKTFFFGWYNGFLLRKTPRQFIYNVPSDAFKAGDLSALLGSQLRNCGPNSDRACIDALGRPIREGAIYDPLTTRTVNGQTVRDPFKGNIIPADRFDSVTTNILPLFPKPTKPDAVLENFLSTAPVGNDINQWEPKSITRFQTGTGSMGRLSGRSYLTKESRHFLVR